MVSNLPEYFENLDLYLANHKDCIVVKSNQYYYYSNNGESYTDIGLPYIRFLDEDELSFLIETLGNDCISSIYTTMLRFHDPNSANYIEKTAPLYEYANKKYSIISAGFTFSFPTKQTIEEAKLFYPTIIFDIARKLKAFRKGKIVRDFNKKTLDGVCAVLPSFLEKDEFPIELVPLLKRKEKSYYLYFIVTRNFFDEPHFDKINFKIPSNYRAFIKGEKLKNLRYIAKILNTQISHINIKT